MHLVMAGCYVIAVFAGRLTAAADTGISLIWPAAGVGVLWVFLAAKNRAGVLAAVVGVGVLAGVVNAATGAGGLIGVVFAVSNAGQSWVALVLFRWLQARLGRSTWWRMRNVTDVVVLGAASVGGVGSVLAIAPVASAYVNNLNYVAVGSVWLLRNVAGIFLILPLVMRLLDPRLKSSSRIQNAWRQRTPELIVIIALTAVTYTAVYGTSTAFTLSFLPMGLTIWAAVRLDTTIAGMHALLSSALIVVLTLAGLGPFAELDSFDRALVAQAYVVAYLVFSWLISSQRDELASLLDDVERSRAEVTQQAELLGALFSTSRDAISVFDAEGNVVMRNAASEDLFRDIPPNARVNDPVVLSKFFRLSDGAPVDPEDAPLSRIARGEAMVGAEMGMMRDGERLVVNITASALPAVAGTEGGSVIVARDVTEARAAQAEIRRARDDYAMLLAAATEQAILACSPDGAIRLASKGAETVFGIPPSEIEGMMLAALLDPEHLAAVADELGVEPEAVHAELARRELSGARRWPMAGEGASVVSMTVTSTPDGGFMCVAWDVTTQVENEERLRVSEARFRQAFDTAPVSMFIVSLDDPDCGTVLETNATAISFTGRDLDDLRGADFTSLVHEDDAVAVDRWIAACAEGHKAQARGEVRFGPHAGGVSWGMVSASVVHLETRKPGQRARCLLCLVEDMTARRAAEDALVRQALHDDLTDLPNRVLLHDRLDFALRSISDDKSRRVGVLFCDLDGFKDVNDAYGHSTGDEVLREVARRFSRAVDAHDTVARLGGDEFAVVRPDVTDEESLAALAHRLIDTLREPVLSTRGTHHLGVSIGMVTGDSDAQTESLLAHADAAMYQAKRDGKNRVHRYDATLLAKSVRTTRLVPELMRALEEGEFVMYGQPVVSLRTGAVESLEMLLRWDSPERGLIPPGEFLDVLEASALMVPVGIHVLHESCRIAASLPPGADGSLPAVHVNVSGRQLTAGDFTTSVSHALEETGLDPRRLILELTETHMPQLTLPLLTDLAVLRERGVRIALDDLGTGYSSLARLTELPIDVLKVDRGFVLGIGTDDRCDAVVRAVVGMGDAMDVDVVAEGVETAEQAAELVRLGCPYGQGYFFARPQPESELVRLVGTTYDLKTGKAQSDRAA